MLKCLFVGLVLVAAPVSVFAQSTKRPGETAGSNTGTSAGSPSATSSGPTGNLANPQAQANMAGQPSNARAVPGSGDADRIPTPVINGKPMSSPVPQPAKPPTSHIIR